MTFSPYRSWYDAQGNFSDDARLHGPGGMVVWDLESGMAGQLAPSSARIAQRNVLQGRPGTTISWDDAMAAAGQTEVAYRNVIKPLLQQQQLKRQLQQQVRMQWTRYQMPWQQ